VKTLNQLQLSALIILLIVTSASPIFTPQSQAQTPAASAVSATLTAMPQPGLASTPAQSATVVTSPTENVTVNGESKPLTADRAPSPSGLITNSVSVTFYIVNSSNNRHIRGPYIDPSALAGVVTYDGNSGSFTPAALSYHRSTISNMTGGAVDLTKGTKGWVATGAIRFDPSSIPSAGCYNSFSYGTADYCVSPYYEVTGAGTLTVYVNVYYPPAPIITDSCWGTIGGVSEQTIVRRYAYTGNPSCPAGSPLTYPTVTLPSTYDSQFYSMFTWLDWVGVSSPICGGRPSGASNCDNVFITFSGYFYFMYAGPTNFVLGSEGGTYLYIDGTKTTGQQIINLWNTHNPLYYWEDGESFSITRGWHLVTIYYFHTTIGQASQGYAAKSPTLSFRWSFTGNCCSIITFLRDAATKQPLSAQVFPFMNSQTFINICSNPYCGTGQSYGLSSGGLVLPSPFGSGGFGPSPPSTYPPTIYPGAFYTADFGGSPGTTCCIEGIGRTWAVFDHWEAWGSGSLSSPTNSITSFTLSNPGGALFVAAYFKLYVPVIIASNPKDAGAAYKDFLSVDGTPVRTPWSTYYYFQMGTTPTISAVSPNAGSDCRLKGLTVSAGCRYVWTSWSDGGAQSHQIFIPYVNSPIVITADFQEQFRLTMSVNPSGTGTTTPASGTSWQNALSSVAISAAPTSGHQFSQWSATGAFGGTYAGASSTFTVKMYGPMVETANFASSGSPPLSIPSTDSQPNTKLGDTDGRLP